MKILITALIVLFVMLQWRFWLGDGGIRELNQSRQEVVKLNATLAKQSDINKALRAEVADLVDGVGEIEERARGELGMVGPDETFYQFVGVKEEPLSDNLAQNNISKMAGEKPVQETLPVQ